MTWCHANTARLVRHYKRVAAHLLNVLSGIVMPLHKLDYYDEEYVGDLMERSADEDDKGNSDGGGI